MLAPVDRAAQTSCISLRDDAVDWERIEMRMNSQTGREEPVYMQQRLRNPGSWRQLVPLRDGKVATEFVLGVIPSPVLNRMEDECRALKSDERSKELGWRSFCHGLRDIKGWHGKKGIPHVEVDGLQYVSPEWIEETFVGPLRHVAFEVGMVIWMWNSLSELDVKN